jgi:hypothetical protein
MLIIGSMVVGILLFAALILLTIILGAIGRESEKDILMRTEMERLAGLDGDAHTTTPHPIHHRYLEA